ncbi:DUF4249 family protein [uncultured Chitinophaga sp.]|jgi:hypothetical protein|uniref:DUF4249 family protein n=1 Tax=uncultured Chitinophaga sp. TaxID=339340 RepID=UPI00262AA869|nr:DUF4249 family protein [uncultured Chitinophaga sp.]
MKKIRSIILLGLAAAAFSACEDTIDLEVPNGKSYPVLDAWLTTENGPQTIRFTNSVVSYTNNTPATVIADATITVEDLTAGITYPFTFSNGAYRNDPGGDKSIGVLGHVYRLTLTYNGETFVATDSIKRVPQIDSISYKYKSEEDALSGEGGYYADLHATDFAGGNDYYWIRSYRNDRSTRNTDQYAINGAFNEDVADGWNFIDPIQEGITDDDRPYQLGEKVIVRIASLSKPSYYFIQQVIDQRENFGLFARVLENVRPNLTNTTPNGKTKILGWFGTSAVSFAERTIH